MVGSQDAGAVLKGLLVQGDGFVEPSGVLVGAGEIVARGQSVWVVGAEGAGASVEGLLVQFDGVVEPACFPVGAGEIIS